jgi:hypothetical protein
MEQLQLLLRDRQKTVALEVILACPTFNAALKLCKDISGLTDDQICLHMGYTPAHFSLIWNGNGNKRHFPENDLNKFMDLCGNKVPLIWLAHHCGYGLHPLMDEKDRQIDELQAALAERDKEIETLVKYRQKGLI